MTPVIAIATHGLTKRFGTVVALDNLNLQVKRGEMYALLGRNGAGKTTAIKALLGMVRPTHGHAEMLGVAIQAGVKGVWGRVGHLVETPTSYPELTVRENLEVARRLYRVADPGAATKSLERLGLAPYADRRAGTLSLGNLQRLGLARALLHDPEVLVLDEPANGLDPAGVVEVRELLRGMVCGKGTTVLMSSHILSEVDRQRKQTQTFLRSDRLSSRLAMWLLPVLAKSGLVHLLVGKRLRALPHGVEPVRLTA